MLGTRALPKPFLRLFVALAFLMAPTLASAAGAIQQLGPATYGNPPVFWANGQVVDSSAIPNWLSSYLDKTFGSAAGTVLCRGSSAWQGLSPGSTSYFLQGSATGCPTWAVPPAAASATNNTALSALASTYSQTVLRLGYATAGDAPALLYASSNAACTLNGGAGDGGSQVQSADGKCWLAVFPSSGMDVREFGAKVDGATDDASAIRAAVAAAALNGLAVVAPHGVSAIGSTIVISAPVFIQGCGMGDYQQSGNVATLNSACSRWHWIGAAGGTMVQFVSPANGPPMQGGGLSDIFLDGNFGSAGYGVNLKSWRKGTFRNVLVFQVATAGWYLNIQTPLSVQPADNQYNLFDHCFYYTNNLPGNTARGLWATGNGAAIPFAANTSLNTWIAGEYETNPNTPAVEFDDTDDNFIYALAAGFHGGGSTVSAIILGSADQDASGNNNPARYNVLSSVAGTVTAKASQTGNLSSHDNVIYGFSLANGIAAPTVETGAGGSLNATLLTYTTAGALQNGFNQYASGTFTPTLAFGTPGTSTWAYATQEGHYSCSNGLVHLEFKVVATPTVGTAAGQVLIKGLPYSVANSGDLSGSYAQLTGNWTGLASAPSFIGGWTSTALAIWQSSASSNNSLTVSNMTSAASHTIVSSVSYLTAGC